MAESSILLTEEIKRYVAENAGKIKVTISSLDDGLKIFHRISMVRIKDEKTTFVILEDYLPIIGEVKGDITLVGRDVFYTIENIHGYYVHKQNEFSLLLKEQHYAE